MRLLAFTLLAAASVGAVGATEAPPLVRTHYEVTIQRGRNTWTVASAANVRPGVPIEHDVGPYRLSLMPRLEPPGHYVLKVSVGLVSHAPGALYVPGSQRFSGNVGYPLEFATTLVGASVKGAIMVAPVTR